MATKPAKAKPVKVVKTVVGLTSKQAASLKAYGTKLNTRLQAKITKKAARMEKKKKGAGKLTSALLSSMIKIA